MWYVFIFLLYFGTVPTNTIEKEKHTTLSEQF
jgi:hypothetical protein